MLAHLSAVTLVQGVCLFFIFFIALGKQHTQDKIPMHQKDLEGNSKEMEQEESLLSFSPLLYYLKC